MSTRASKKKSLTYSPLLTLKTRRRRPLTTRSMTTALVVPRRGDPGDRLSQLLVRDCLDAGDRGLDGSWLSNQLVRHSCNWESYQPGRGIVVGIREARTMVDERADLQSALPASSRTMSWSCAPWPTRDWLVRSGGATMSGSVAESGGR
jgi:hypothetical protein